MQAIKELKNEENFTNLISAFKRMSHIITDFFKKQTLPSGEINESLFEKEKEIRLFQFSKKLNKYLKGYPLQERNIETDMNFQKVFSFLADSKQLVDDFFDHVMVMHEDKQYDTTGFAFYRASSKI